MKKLTNQELLDGLKNDLLHVLLNTYVYMNKLERIGEISKADSPCPYTRHDFKVDILGLQAIADNITIATARMYDRAKNTRSILKIDEYKTSKSIKDKVDKFLEEEGKELLDHRNNKLAHMNQYLNIEYPYKQIPDYTFKAISFLVNLLDELSGEEINYTVKLTELVDLRKELNSNK